MVHLETKDLYKKEYAMLWSLLSFKAGLLNAAGLLLAGTYVSHVTGFGTQIGLSFGHEDFKFGIELLVIPLSFIGGGLITSLVLDRNSGKGLVPNYPVVQFMITFLIGLISIGFATGLFDAKTVAGPSEKSILLIGLLCLVCGLKNGLTTWASHGKIRTTHLTGLATDVGLHLQKTFRREGACYRYPESKNVNYVRIATLLSFSVGSCISAILIPTIGYKIFHLSFVISLGLSIFSVLHRRIILTSNQKQKVGAIYAYLN